MTAQINDTLTYAGDEWSLAGVNGGPLFEPTAFGLEATATSSICWRGFTCRYELRDGQLLLQDVSIGLAVPAPRLLGREPELAGEQSAFTAFYREMEAPVPFTGGLLLARGFLRQHYVHMGFHPAWKYEEVVEAELEAGRVLRFLDCSSAMAEVRGRLAGKEAPDSANRQEIRLWIERAFSRRY